MPCYEVREQSVELAITNRDLLASACKALGWRVQAIDGYRQSLIMADGCQFTIKHQEKRVVYSAVNAGKALKAVDTLKRQCGVEAVKRASARYGWRADGVQSLNARKREAGKVTLTRL